jgi:hypothetical protein
MYIKLSKELKLPKTTTLKSNLISSSNLLFNNICLFYIITPEIVIILLTIFKKKTINKRISIKNAMNIGILTKNIDIVEYIIDHYLIFLTIV